MLTGQNIFGSQTISYIIMTDWSSWAQNNPQHLSLPYINWWAKRSTSRHKVLENSHPQVYAILCLFWWKYISVSLLSTHSCVPTRNIFHTNPLQTTHPTPFKMCLTLSKKTVTLNVRIQLLCSVAFPPRALHYTLPSLYCALVWPVSSFHLHFLRPPYFSLINV